jgi:hypothetical protein
MRGTEKVMDLKRKIQQKTNSKASGEEKSVDSSKTACADEPVGRTVARIVGSCK